ncbi:MAG: hypothetical protein JNK26_04605 [Candidatus Doudnabacteria bacterium]|nr:hypothetical protein [Candidatus Doudnabacteria bacterium]
MGTHFQFPNKPDTIPNDLKQRRLAAIDAIRDLIQASQSLEVPISEKLYGIIYRFLPYILSDYEAPSLQNFIVGYSNDYIVMYALKQLEKIAALLYGVEVYNNTDSALTNPYESLRDRATKILVILSKWLEVQNDKSPVQIAELDELTAEDFREALGWNLAANFHLFDLLRKQTNDAARVGFGDAVYDLNYTPDAIHRIADVFAYMLWKAGRIDTLEIVLAFYNSPYDYSVFVNEWCAQRPELIAEQSALEAEYFSAAFAREKPIRFHQGIGYHIAVMKQMADPNFVNEWLDKVLESLDSSVLRSTGILSAREMLKSLFDGLLATSCSDEMIDEVLAEINTKKGLEG